MAAAWLLHGYCMAAAKHNAPAQGAGALLGIGLLRPAHAPSGAAAAAAATCFRSSRLLSEFHGSPYFSAQIGP